MKIGAVSSVSILFAKMKIGSKYDRQVLGEFVKIKELKSCGNFHFAVPRDVGHKLNVGDEIFFSYIPSSNDIKSVAKILYLTKIVEKNPTNKTTTNREDLIGEGTFWDWQQSPSREIRENGNEIWRKHKK